MFEMIPDEMMNHEPSSFDDAKRGWHDEAMKKMPAEKLVQLLAMIGAKTIKEAIHKIDGLGREGYMGVMSMYEHDED